MNPNVEAISGSLIREIASKRKSTSIDLGLGEPTLLPTQKYFDRAAEWVSRNGMRYTVNAGDHELREQIAQHYAYPDRSDASNVCVMSGSQEAVYVSMKTLLDARRDEVLIVEPAFPAYAKMAQLEGVAVRRLALSEDDQFSFDVERIFAGVGERTRLIVICSPSNPTARVMGKAAVRRLGELLLQRRGRPVYVLHDEIYRELLYTEDAGYFAERYPYTIVANSLSKSNALTGLRIGWTIAGDELAAGIVKTHAWVTSCASTFSQRVAIEIFNDGALAEHAAAYREQRAAVLEALQASGLRFISPDGGFYACVRLPEGVTSLDAALTLAHEDDVIAIPGSAFGDCFEGWLRLSWVAPIEAVREGIARVARRYGAVLPTTS